MKEKPLRYLSAFSGENFKIGSDLEGKN